MTKKQYLQQILRPILANLYGSEWYFYGPYLCKDKRRRVVLYNGQKRITRQYSKLKMEALLHRKLNKDETTDHIDRNTLNDRYNNLRLLDRSEHAKQDARYLKTKQFTCPVCLSKFKLQKIKLSRVISKSKKGHAGPFCSKSCAGQYGASVQWGRSLRLIGKIIKPQYKRLLKCG